ncbi:uncharacterized protein MYCGRDRAFT_93545 [Zymoseptoria tritici IPO323]|uniref:Uncharacterized protein n=1 Tax=Zymoseptoria tritici (strain CBS 115943 / IPO323) TaxID=336722 RepID=F9XB39_ZYMTI|nr:uncharacterized protein MYCGRDRAFT_93545 [Zymoseptoria tritici IPO323]EGP87410.1 hypothetical protein MYCGRDRAFT_93545 [Zymoseptoria tritici IPO323]
MARRKRSIPAPEAPSAAEAEVRQLELARNQNDQKLKSRFERIFRKYEHDFTDVGDEIDIESGDIVVDNGHLQNMRDEADPGQSRSASSRFVKTFQEKLGHEGEDDDEEEEEDDEEDYDDESGDGEDDEEDQSDGTDETEEGDNVDTFERLPTVEPFRALKRPPPRLAQLLVGGTTPVDDLDASIEDSASGTSTPTGLLAQVPALQASMSTLASKAKRPTVDTDTIQALGLTIANQLAQLMAGTSKKRKRHPRPVSRSNTTDPAWDYPEITHDRSTRRKQRRMKSPVPPADNTSPQAPSPDQRSLWAPTGRQKKNTWKEANAATPVRRVLRSSLVASSVLKKEDLRRCGNCSLTNSITWQPGPNGEDLCTSCGRYYDYHGRMKPFDSPTPSVEDLEEDGESSGDSSFDIRFESAQSTPALVDGANDAAMDSSSRAADGKAEGSVKPRIGQSASEKSPQRISQLSRGGKEPQRTSSVVQQAPSISDGPQHTQADAMPFQAASTSHTTLPGSASEASLRRHPAHTDLASVGHASILGPSLAPTSRHDPSLQRTKRGTGQSLPLVEHQIPAAAPFTRTQPVQSVIGNSALDVQPNGAIRSPSRLRSSTQPSAPSLTQQPYPMGAPTDQSAWLANNFAMTAPTQRESGRHATTPFPTTQFGSNTGEVPYRSAVVPEQSVPSAPAGTPKKEYDIFVNETPATLYTANTSRVISDAESPGGVLVPYTAEEDATIIRLKEIDKLQWVLIADHLPERTAFSIQSHYRRVLQGKLGAGRRLLEARLAKRDQSPPAPPLPAAPHDPEWDNDEDELLLELREDRELEWDEIAEIMDNHTEARLESRYEEIVESSRSGSSILPDELRTGALFSAEEDALIVRLREIDHVPWNNVAQHFRGRQLHSIQKRYSRVLAPAKRKLPPVDPSEMTLEQRMFEVDPELAILLHSQSDPKAFNPREDQLILQLRDQNLSWQAIAPSFPGRTAETLQIRHAELLASKEREQQIATTPFVRRTDAAPQTFYHAASGQSTTPYRSLAPMVNARPVNNGASFAVPPQHGTNAQSVRGPAVAPHTYVPNSESAAPFRHPSDVQSSNHGPGMRHPFTKTEDDTILQLREKQGYGWHDIAVQLPGRSVNSISTRYMDILRRGDPSARQGGNAPGVFRPDAAQRTAGRGTKASQNHHSANARSNTRQSLPSATMVEARVQPGLLRHALNNSRRLSDFVSEQTRGKASRGHNIDDPISLDDDDDNSTVAISQQLNEELRHSVARPAPSNATKGTSTISEIRSADTRANAGVSSTISSKSSPRVTASSAALQHFLSRAPQQPKLPNFLESKSAHAVAASATVRHQQASAPTFPAASRPASGTSQHDTTHDTSVTQTKAAPRFTMASPGPAAAPGSQFQRQSRPVLDDDVAGNSPTHAAEQSEGRAAMRQKGGTHQPASSTSTTAIPASADAILDNAQAESTSAAVFSAPIHHSRGSGSEESLVMPEKPRYSMLQLVHMAFQASQSETMFPREVAAWVQTNFEYYRAVPDTWKSGILTELNYKDHFEPVETHRGREFRLRPGVGPEVASRPQKTRGHARRVGEEKQATRDRSSTAVKQAQDVDHLVGKPKITTNSRPTKRDITSRTEAASPSSSKSRVPPVAPIHPDADDCAPVLPLEDSDSITVVQPKRGRPRGSKMRKYSEDDDDDEYTPQQETGMPISNVATRARLRRSTGSTQASTEVETVNEPSGAFREIPDSDEENSQEVSSPVPMARSSEKRVHFMETVEVRRPIASHERPTSSNGARPGISHQEQTAGQHQTAAPTGFPLSSESSRNLPAPTSSTAFVKPSTPASVLRKPKSRVSDGALAIHPRHRIAQLRKYETPRRASTGMPIFTPQRAGTPTAVFAYRASPAASGAGDRFGYGRRVVETPVRELADPNEDELA